jgi:N utilization substance protein B
MTGERRRARELALKTLFEVDAVGHEPDQVWSRLIEDTPISSEGSQFGKRLTKGVLQNRESIDALIGEVAPAWPVNQIALVDRNILRLAIFELMFDNEVPEKAIFNEAIELAKQFGSEQSPKFVNGVLGSVERNPGRPIREKY